MELGGGSRLDLGSGFVSKSSYNDQVMKEEDNDDDDELGVCSDDDDSSSSVGSRSDSSDDDDEERICKEPVESMDALEKVVNVR